MVLPVSLTCPETPDVVHGLIFFRITVLPPEIVNWTPLREDAFWKTTVLPPSTSMVTFWSGVCPLKFTVLLDVTVILALLTVV